MIGPLITQIQAEWTFFGQIDKLERTHLGGFQQLCRRVDSKSDDFTLFV